MEGSTAQPRVEYVTTKAGVRLAYEHHRPAPGRPARPTVIFSCAYCTTRENWRAQIAPLLAAGHPVVVWDLRAHGDSRVPAASGSLASPGADLAAGSAMSPAAAPAAAPSAAWSIDDIVADLDAIAEATTPAAPFVAAGLSFGGLASLHYAVRHPERVAALVLIASGPGFKNAEAAAAWAAQVERTARFLETRGLEAFVAGRAGTTCIGSRPELPAAQAAARAIVAQDVAGLARFGREVSGPAPPVIDALGGIDVPALVLVGEHDQPFLRAGEVMAAKLPRARHVVVPDAGHIVNIEQAERFDRELRGFLESLDTSEDPSRSRGGLLRGARSE